MVLKEIVDAIPTSSLPLFKQMEGVSQNSGFVISHACGQVMDLARGDQGKGLFSETPLEGNSPGALLRNYFPPFFNF